MAAVRESASTFEVGSHKLQFAVARNTARADLQGLVEAGILVQHKEGNRYVFSPVTHLSKHIMKGALVPHEGRAEVPRDGGDVTEDESPTANDGAPPNTRAASLFPKTNPPTETEHN
jgi:hypothetical protein